jgi:hypothetical protein
LNDRRENKGAFGIDPIIGLGDEPRSDEQQTAGGHDEIAPWHALITQRRRREFLRLERDDRRAHL